MKRKNVCFIALIIFISAILLSCEGDGTRSPYKDADINNPEKLWIKTSEETLSQNGMTIYITNESESDYLYGDDFEVESLDKDGWHTVKKVVRDTYVFSTFCYSVKKGNTVSCEVKWEWLYGSLQKGEYRLIKTFKKNENDSPTEYITVSFKIFS